MSSEKTVTLWHDVAQGQKRQRSVSEDARSRRRITRYLADGESRQLTGFGAALASSWSGVQSAEDARVGVREEMGGQTTRRHNEDCYNTVELTVLYSTTGERAATRGHTYTTDEPRRPHERELLGDALPYRWREASTHFRTHVGGVHAGSGAERAQTEPGGPAIAPSAMVCAAWCVWSSWCIGCRQRWRRNSQPKRAAAAGTSTTPQALLDTSLPSRTNSKHRGAAQQAFARGNGFLGDASHPSPARHWRLLERGVRPALFLSAGEAYMSGPLLSSFAPLSTSGRTASELWTAPPAAS
jgi:hypothetical protein